MAKLSLFLEPEVSVPEERKGKQIAVKESNITSLKQFFANNYQPPKSTLETEIIEAQPTSTEPENIDVMIKNSPIDFMKELNNIEVSINTTEEPIINETPINPINEKPEETPIIDVTENSDSSNGEIINLIPEIEEMDPELKEIKNRLDQVINDLDQYKKKIKNIEIEINLNLEKSREVLKDTQAAAHIMSIQQERQKQIKDEVAGGGEPLNDPSRILQKESII